MPQLMGDLVGCGKADAVDGRRPCCGARFPGYIWSWSRNVCRCAWPWTAPRRGLVKRSWPRAARAWSATALAMLLALFGAHAGHRTQLVRLIENNVNGFRAQGVYNALGQHGAAALDQARAEIASDAFGVAGVPGYGRCRLRVGDRIWGAGRPCR